MKKYLVVILIFVALLTTSLKANDPVYPDWEWIDNVWVYTGVEFPPPLPPPPPPLPEVR